MVRRSSLFFLRLGTCRLYCRLLRLVVARRARRLKFLRCGNFGGWLSRLRLWWRRRFCLLGRLGRWELMNRLSRVLP